MDQECTHLRTTKTTVTSAGGVVESMKTHVLKSIHKESHLMATNYGPMGLTDNQEPNDARKALSNRAWAMLVPPAPSNSTEEDDDFKRHKESTEMRRKINRFRVITCLIANVLIFIEEIPFCQPDLTYAKKLCKQWDKMLDDDFNLPQPAKRKKLKRKMLFHLFCVESAVVEHYLYKETACQYEDMRPLPDGSLPPWQMETLVEVVKSLQRTLDFEVIVNAWSHGLGHSPATSAHVFHVKTVLAQMHGAALDHQSLSTTAEDEAQRAAQRTAAARAASPDPPPEFARTPAARGAGAGAGAASASSA